MELHAESVISDVCEILDTLERNKLLVSATLNTRNRLNRSYKSNTGEVLQTLERFFEISLYTYYSIVRVLAE